MLVLGIGNSAVDIAVESSRIAEKTFLATRRGAYVIPKYINGKPIDELSNPVTSMLPLAVQRFFATRALGVASAADPTAYGLPKPDHKLFEAHPTVSSELLPRLGHGDIPAKPNIERFSGGRSVRFADGSEEEIDLVVYCTGYKITFPFFDPRSSPPRTTAFLSTAASSRSTARGSTSSASSSRSARSCLWPRRSASGSPTCSAGAATLPPAAEMRKRSRARNGRCGSATLPLSVIRSRSTSILICARSGASESRLRSRPDDPGAAARAGRRAAAPRAPPPWGPRRGPRGSFGRGRRLKPPSSSAVPSGSGVAWLAHQTSHSAPKTGILRTTSRKKIGQNPVTMSVSP